MTTATPPPAEAITFIELGPEGGHAQVLGGLTTLERVIRLLGKRGVTRVAVPAAPVPVDAGGVPHGVAVDWVAPETRPGGSQPTIRGDEIAGVRVTDEASRRRAEWEVLRTLPKPHQGPTDAAINWRFSLRITRVLSKTRITPNQITLIATVFGLAACAVALLGSYWAIAAAGVMIQVHNILDSCDGELARLRLQFTKLGAWLDTILDEVVDVLFIIAMGVVAGGWWMVIGLAGGIGRLIANVLQWEEGYRLTGSGAASAFRYWFESYDDKPEEVWDRKTVLFWVRALGRRDTYCFVFMLLCLANQPQAVAVYGAIPGIITFFLMMVHVVLRKPRPAATP